MMTKDEERVRAVYPRATIERQKGHDSSVYYLVRKGPGAWDYITDGDTKARAWKAAAMSLPTATEEPR